jgi:hypothetical protein
MWVFLTLVEGLFSKQDFGGSIPLTHSTARHKRGIGRAWSGVAWHNAVWQVRAS